MQIKQVNFEFKQKNGDNIVTYEIVDSDGKVVFKDWCNALIRREDMPWLCYPNITEAALYEKRGYLYWLLRKLFDEYASQFFRQYKRESWCKLIDLKFKYIKISNCNNKFEFTNTKEAE